MVVVSVQMDQTSNESSPFVSPSVSFSTVNYNDKIIYKDCTCTYIQLDWLAKYKHPSHHLDYPFTVYGVFLLSL